jgi:hypothetical protein
VIRALLLAVLLCGCGGDDDESKPRERRASETVAASPGD